MISIQINTVNLQHAFDALIGRLQDTSPLMQRVSHTMLTGVLENFEQGGRPAWAKKWDGSTSKLQDTGRLKSSITRDFDRASAVVGTNVVYGPIHHFGGVIKPKRAKALRFNGRFASQVTMPSRPFLTLSDEDLDYIEQIGQNYLTGIID